MHSSLGDRARLCLKKIKKEREEKIEAQIGWSQVAMKAGKNQKIRSQSKETKGQYILTQK